MKICFPIDEERALESEVFGHFGSAPSFLMVDTETGSHNTISNSNRSHTHGTCKPIEILGGAEVDAIISCGIGGGALRKVNNQGVKVYRAEGRTVRDNLELFAKGTLSEFTPLSTCSMHLQAGGCAH